MLATCSCCRRLECSSLHGLVLRDGTEKTFLKARLTEGDIVRLMSPRFPPPPPPASYLPFPSSCLVAPLCFLLCFPSTASSFFPPPHNDTSFPPSCFFLTSILGIDKWDVGQTRAFHPAAFDMEIHLPQQKQDNSTPLSLCQTCCRCPPRCWKWGVFTLLGRIEWLATSQSA